MPRTTKRTWILIADGGRARVLQSMGGGQHLEEVVGLVQAIDLPASRDIADDKQGRSYDSVGAHRHAIERRTDPHRELKRHFAEHLAEMIDAKAAEGALDRLVVVAPAVTMGDLRPAFSKRVLALVTAEIVSDLTKVPDDEIMQHLEKHMTL